MNNNQMQCPVILSANSSVVTTKNSFSLEETKNGYQLKSANGVLAQYPRHYPYKEVVVRANNFLSSWGYSLKD